MAFLSHEERIELTGAATKRGQIEALKSNRIPFFTRADGWPVLTWEVVNGTLMRPSSAEDAEGPRLHLLPNKHAAKTH